MEIKVWTLIQYTYYFPPYTYTHSVVCESRPPAVVYETVSDVVTPTGPDTSENVAYGVSHSLPTTTQHNPAYGVAKKKRLPGIIH